VCIAAAVDCRVLEVSEPPVRKAGAKVDSVDTLLTKLRKEAGVI
jgi:hypothetical protein